MTRAAPSVDDIVGLAAEINSHALSGRHVQLPYEAQTQMHTAIPGAPGVGLRILGDALHPKVSMRTLERSGDLIFFVSRAEGEGRLATTSQPLPGSGA